MGGTRRFLADFHLHSQFSDGKLTIPEIVDLFGSHGFGAIAITDHIAEKESLIGKASVWLNQVLTEERFPEYMEIIRCEAERAWDQYRMVVLPGFELSKNSVSNRRSAHILGIGVQNFLYADGDPKELAISIREQGALAVAAHPVFSRKFEKQTYHLWDRAEELAPYFDAWEVASGQFLFQEVKAAPLPKIASSDMHIPEHMASWKTVLDCERHPEAILDAIRRQKIDFTYYPETEIDPRTFSPKNVSASQTSFLLGF